MLKQINERKTTKKGNLFSFSVIYGLMCSDSVMNMEHCLHNQRDQCCWIKGQKDTTPLNQDDQICSY